MHVATKYVLHLIRFLTQPPTADPNFGSANAP